jgi:hypothetical protein
MYLKKFALRLPFFFARRLARLNPESEPRSEKQPFLACIPDQRLRNSKFSSIPPPWAYPPASPLFNTFFPIR